MSIPPVACVQFHILAVLWDIVVNVARFILATVCMISGRPGSIFDTKSRFKSKSYAWIEVEPG